MSRSNGGVAELRQLCLATFSQRHGGILVPLAQRRLDEELAAIGGQGRVKDFLAAADVRRWAGEKAIALRLVGAGGNSLGAFCLGLSASRARPAGSQGSNGT